MKSKPSAFVFLVIISTVSFLLGLLFTTRSIEENIIHMAIDNIANVTINLNSDPNRRLVPEGCVTTPYETEELELTYKLVARGFYTKRALNTDINSINDDEGSSFLPYLIIKKPDITTIKSVEYLTYKIRLVTPIDRAEYERIANKNILLSIKFWIG